MGRNTRTGLGILLTVFLLTSGIGCVALREVANLRLVEFDIDQLSNIRLAGVDVERIRRYEELSPRDLARISAAALQGELPLSFRLHVQARNPEENQVQARLLRMDWTLFLENRKTVSGVLEEEYVLPAGSTTDIPLYIELDLAEFFEHNTRDLVELALSLAGVEDGGRKQVRLEARPTIDTVFGRLRYPRPITIVSRDVG